MKRLDFAEKLVERARALGADEAEAFVSDSSEVEIKIRDGKPEAVNYNDSSGYGVRVLKDGKMGFASSNNCDAAEAEEVLTRLISYTLLHTADEHNILPAPVAGSSDDASLSPFDEDVRKTPVEEKIAKAVIMETAAWEADARIVQTPYVQYGDSSIEFAIASSAGISGESRRTEVYGAVVALGMANDDSGQPDPNVSQTGTGIDVTASFAALNPQTVGNKAVTYATRMLGAADGSTREVEAVFPPETGTNFVKLIADMVSADLVQKKKSIFSGKLGEMVASSRVTIIDDGHLKGGLASTAVDGEGVPSTTTTIIDSGKLSSYLYDSYTAHRGNTISTGNAYRRSFAGKPFIAPTNFFMKAGTVTREKLMGAVGAGLFVTEVSGLHASVDPVTGNFSIPAKGILIANGELTTPVANITLSGNIFDFFKDIDTVADDLTWEPRDYVIGAPTFKVKQIKVSGK